MLTFVTIVHVLLCVFMIFVILLQPGKDAGMGAALGGGAATSAFGGRGAVTFLSKLTGFCAAMFFMTSLGLSFVGVKGSVATGSLAAEEEAAAPIEGGGNPATPASDAAQGGTPSPQGPGAPAPQGAAPAGAPDSVEQPRPTPAPPAK